MRKRRYSRDAKPPLGVRLNPHHPLAQYVVEMFLCNQGGGPPTGLLTGFQLPFLNSPTWGMGGFLTNTTGAGASTTAPAWARLQPPFSVVWQGRFMNITIPGFAPVFDVSYNSSHSSPYTAITFYADSTSVSFYSNNAGSQVNIGNASTLSHIGRNQIVGTLSPSAMNIYFNGDSVHTPNSGWTTVNYDATAQICLGCNVGYQSVNPTQMHDFVIMFRHELTRDDVRSLWIDPYALLEPRGVRSRSTGSLAVTTNAALLPAM